MKYITVVGAGGIGSWLAYFLYDLEKNGQLPDTGFTFYDDDVVEQKNVRYQNFETDDITDDKVESISARYGFVGVSERIEDISVIADSDCVICAVDNRDFREKLFTTFNTENSPYWIDLRSEGRSYAYYTKHLKNTTDILLATLPSGDEADINGGSCQLEWELSEGIIQQGNKIIAGIASQLILNWLRGEHNALKHITNI